MILGFNKRFVVPISQEVKIHTLREDPHDKWKIGRFIHFATGVRTKHYSVFRVGACFSTQQCNIIYGDRDPETMSPEVCVDGRKLETEEIQTLARNDGFDDTVAFFEWFNKDWSGKIIHWTPYRY